MGNFNGLIFLTQLQQNSRLADMRDGIDAVHTQLGRLHRHQQELAQAQQRLDYLRQEVFTFGQHLQQTSQNMNRTAGLACYWSFRFLLWASQEKVETASFAEYQDKLVFSEVLTRAHDILNHSAKQYYSKEDLNRIERAMLMDCGMREHHKTYLNWNKIKTIASENRFLFSAMNTVIAAPGIVLFLIPGILTVFMVCKEWGYPKSILDYIVLGGIALVVTPLAGGLLALLGRALMQLCLLGPILKRNTIVRQTLHPLASEVGGSVANNVTLEAINHIVAGLKTNLQNTWGNIIHVYDSLDEIERYHQSLTDEYADTKQCLIDSPPCTVPPHIRNLEPLISERKESR